MKLLVVSHACTVEANRDVYRELASRTGWDIRLVTPSNWPVDYEKSAETAFWAGRVHMNPVARPGSVQRHSYPLLVPRKWIKAVEPDFLIIEEETYSLSGLQWSMAARLRNVPYALQSAENLRTRVPRWWRGVTRSTVSNAALVMARSQTAREVAELWGANGTAHFVPHALPNEVLRAARLHQGLDNTLNDTERLDHQTESTKQITIGFAGRLEQEKGVETLVLICRKLRQQFDVRLVIAGRGTSQKRITDLQSEGMSVAVGTYAHDRMNEFYEQIDMLLVPSRTTPTWTEQFGRVIVEAAAFGRPVIGSSSGEIPWVIGDLNAGRVADEDDVDEWCRHIVEMAGTQVPDVGLMKRSAERYGAAPVAGILAELVREGTIR